MSNILTSEHVNSALEMQILANSFTRLPNIINRPCNGQRQAVIQTCDPTEQSKGKHVFVSKTLLDEKKTDP